MTTKKTVATGQAGNLCVHVSADAFNEATLQLNRAMGIADALYALSLVDGGIESMANGMLTSALDAMFDMMNDAYGKLAGVGSAGDAQ